MYNMVLYLEGYEEDIRVFLSQDYNNILGILSYCIKK